MAGASSFGLMRGFCSFKAPPNRAPALPRSGEPGVVVVRRGTERIWTGPGRGDDRVGEAKRAKESGEEEVATAMEQVPVIAGT